MREKRYIEILRVPQWVRARADSVARPNEKGSEVIHRWIRLGMEADDAARVVTEKAR
jgi:hypothetical protein